MEADLKVMERYVSLVKMVRKVNGSRPREGRGDKF